MPYGYKYPADNEIYKGKIKEYNNIINNVVSIFKGYSDRINEKIRNNDHPRCPVV